MHATWRHALPYLVTLSIAVGGGCGEPGWLPTLDVWTRARLQRGDHAGGSYTHVAWIAGASVGWAARARSEAGTRWMFRGTPDALMRTGGDWSADSEWVIPGHTGPMSISPHDGAPRGGMRGDVGDLGSQGSQANPALGEEPRQGWP